MHAPWRGPGSAGPLQMAMLVAVLALAGTLLPTGVGAHTSPAGLLVSGSSHLPSDEPISTANTAITRRLAQAAGVLPGAAVSTTTAGGSLLPRCAAGAAPGPGGGCTQCQPGWAPATGFKPNDCMVCKDSSVCPTFTGQRESTCDVGLHYHNTTRYKAYECDLVGGLARYVPYVVAICNVRGERLPFKDGVLGLQPGALYANAPPGMPFCQIVIGINVTGNAANSLVCSTQNCSMEAGSPNFACSKTECACGGGPCPGVFAPFLKQLENASIGLTCADTGDGRCYLAGLKPRFSLTCRAGECTQPQDPAPLARAMSGADGSNTAKTHDDLLPPSTFRTVAGVTAAPIGLLILLGSALALQVLAAGRYFTSSSSSAAKNAGGDGAAAGGAVGGPLLRASSLQRSPRKHSADSQKGSGGGGSGVETPGRSAFVFEVSSCSVPAAAAATPGSSIGGGGVLSPAASSGGGAAAVAAPTNAFSKALQSFGLGLSSKAKGSTNADLLSPLPTPAGSGGGGVNPLSGQQAPSGGRSRRKVLLSGIAGAVEEGELLGVLGPSGSGKSTLLSILSGSTESLGAGARVDAWTSLAGETRRDALRRATAFVPQKDVLLPALTVEECVRYSALLRLPRNLSAAQIQDRISSVLAELGLSHVSSSLVGGSPSIRGVSGGERRRVTIAMALVTRPNLVIMDEPTSGLDSYTACLLVRAAAEIAAHNRIVIMSLHQPSRDIFDSLSRVLLLAGGRAAYLGPPSGVGPAFAAAGLPVPRGRQPAEHMLEVVSTSAGLSALLEAKLGDSGVTSGGGAIAAARSTGGGGDVRRRPAAAGGGGGSTPGSGESEALTVIVRDGAANGTTTTGVATTNGAAAAAAAGQAAAAGKGGASTGDLSVLDAGASTDASSSEWGGASAAATAPSPSLIAALREGTAARARAAAVLSWRAFTNTRREPRLLLLHLVIAGVLGLVVGAIFFRLENTQVGIQNRLGCMFFALALFGWTSVSAVEGLVHERELVEREVAGKWYGAGTYLLSALVLDGLLLRTLPALLFTALMYPMVGLLPDPARVATFMFVLATYSCTVGALTMGLTALCTSAAATTLAMNIVLLMWVLVGGYLVNPGSIPAWLRWVRSLSPMSFALEVLAASEMGDRTFILRVASYAELEGIEGNVFLRALGLEPSHALGNALALMAFYAAAVALAFVATSYALWRRTGGGLRSLLRRGGGGAR